MKSETEIREKLVETELRLAKTPARTAITILHSRIGMLRWVLEEEGDDDFF